MSVMVWTIAVMVRRWKRDEHLLQRRRQRWLWWSVGFNTEHKNLAVMWQTIRLQDSKRKIHPGAVEICDGKDNSCDGQIDEGVQKTFYQDADKDGYGNPSASIQSCRAPEGYVKNNTDCSDVSSTVHDAGTSGICNNQGGNDSDDENESDDDENDGFTHNFRPMIPHNEITDCMSCHSGLKIRAPGHKRGGVCSPYIVHRDDIIWMLKIQCDKMTNWIQSHLWKLN
jgi:hypothetical protein